MKFWRDILCNVALLMAFPFFYQKKKIYIYIYILCRVAPLNVSFPCLLLLSPRRIG